MSRGRRKGFYFSFDAILALMIMAVTMVFAVQSSSIASSEFESKKAQFEASASDGRDVVRLAAIETFETFNSSFRQNLVDNTVMGSDDMNRSVLEGITYLWAAGNQDYAVKAIKTYFGARVDEKYALRIEEGDSSYLVYNTSSSENADTVSVAQTLVSGFRLNKSATGFRARATVVGALTNTTRVFPISPAGAVPGSFGFGSLQINKRFNVGSFNEVQEAHLDISTEQGIFSGATVTINGNEVEVDSSNQLASQGTAAYYRVDITPYIVEGENTLDMELNSISVFSGTVLFPGSRVEVSYTRPPVRNTDLLERKEVSIKEVQSFFFGFGESGVFNLENFNIPEESEVVNATLNVNADGVGSSSSPTGWDVFIELNNNTLVQDSASGSYSTPYLNVTDEIRGGTNLLRILVNHDGDDQFWGGGDTHLAPGDNSSIVVWYREPPEIGYGKFETRLAEEVGGASSNPKLYTKDFEYTDLSTTSLYLSQFETERPKIQVRNGSNPYQTVFNAPEAASTPTVISIDPRRFDTNATNYINMSDPGSQAVFLPYSLFEYKVFAPTRVGYGDVFATPEAAQQDARERLADLLGPSFDATDINANTVAIGNQKKLWGPSIVKLVVWDE